MSKQIFGRQPVVVVALIQAVLVFATSMGWLDFIGINSAQDETYLYVVLNALAAVYLALGTTETLMAACIELFKAVAALMVFYGLEFGTDKQAMAIGIITAAFAFWNQRATSPQAKLAVDPVRGGVLVPGDVRAA